MNVYWFNLLVFDSSLMYRSRKYPKVTDQKEALLISATSGVVVVAEGLPMGKWDTRTCLCQLHFAKAVGVV